jgi:NADH-quinone oxidoreductase subunit L
MIISSSLIQFAVFWELMGVTSFLLIGFYRNDQSEFGSRKAYIFTYIGDVSLLLFVSQMYFKGIIFFNQIASLTIAEQILILIAIISKSSQLPLLWLQDAMVAPTPVSALLHSATMVISGAFLLLLLRNYVSFIFYPLLFVSIVTTLVALVLALFESNSKKFLAYFTVSSISTMLAGAFISPIATLFYIFIHAFYKVAGFINAGIEKLRYNEEDMYRLSGKKISRLEVIDYILLSMLLGNVALTPSFFIHSAIFDGSIISFILSFMFAIVALKYLVRVKKIGKAKFTLLSYESFILLLLSFSLLLFVVSNINIVECTVSLVGVLLGYALWIRKSYILSKAFNVYSKISNSLFKFSALLFSFFAGFNVYADKSKHIQEIVDAISLSEEQMLILAIIGLIIALAFAI